MVASMPTALWINPRSTVVWMLPFMGLFLQLGAIKWPQLCLIMALQIFMGLAARPPYRGAIRN